jgi:hypothetical protein
MYREMDTGFWLEKAQATRRNPGQFKPNAGGWATWLDGLGTERGWTS